MSSTKRINFSGQPQTGLFENQNNCVFFSSALIEDRVGNEIEVDEINVTVTSSEVFSMPIIEDTRIFTAGPNSVSRTNNSLYRTLYKEPSVIATITQTIPPGPTTIIKIK